MKKKVISIVTNYGGDYGTGHLQRMFLLCDYLNRNTSYATHLVCQNKITISFDKLFPSHKQIDPKSSLIIRDMRDSTGKDISDLQTVAPVLAVDDVGSGRLQADLAIDLLPNLLHAVSDIAYHPECYLYGYQFYHSLQTVNEKENVKDIDVSVYLGSDVNNPQLQSLIHAISNKYTLAMLNGEQSYLIKKGSKQDLDDPLYALLLLSSKVLLTYFGLTMFDGLACGCNVVTVNPGKYHCDLSDLVVDKRIKNAGKYSTITEKKVIELIDQMIVSRKTKVGHRFIVEDIESKVTLFIKMIDDLI